MDKEICELRAASENEENGEEVGYFAMLELVTWWTDEEDLNLLESGCRVSDSCQSSIWALPEICLEKHHSYLAHQCEVGMRNKLFICAAEIPFSFNSFE